MTVAGKTMGELHSDTAASDRDVIRAYDNPLMEEAGFVVLSGNLFDSAIMKTSVMGESVVALNEGNGKFTVKDLPSWVQLSCVCGVTCTDLNQDGNIDLILGGNNFFLLISQGINGIGLGCLDGFEADGEDGKDKGS